MTKEVKYTNIYVLPNECEIKVRDSYCGEYIRLHKCREYLSGDKKGEILQTDDWKDIRKDDRFKKIEEINMVASLEGDFKLQEVKDTFVLAKRKETRPVKNIEHYTHEHARNCKYHTAIKIKLQDEDYKRDLIVEWDGKFSVFNFIDNLEDNLWEELMENGEKHFVTYPDKDREDIYEEEYPTLEFYTDEGKFLDIELESSYKLAQMVIGIELIEFNEEIVK